MRPWFAWLRRVIFTRRPAWEQNSIHAVLLTRPGCSLCDKMKASLERAGRDQPIALEERDISRDPHLEAVYRERIPLLWLNGRLSAKYRIDDSELRDKLERARAVCVAVSCQPRCR